MARTPSRTEQADPDTTFEIKSLCQKHGVSRLEYYHATNLYNACSLSMFYAALRGDAITAGLEREMDLSLVTFRDWLASKQGKAEINNPTRRAKAIHARLKTLLADVEQLIEQLDD